MMKEKKGEITVFLALVLTILISVLFTVIETARINAIQFQTECVADMALQSALAEYNRELLEQYELFFIETGYGTKEAGYILLEQHLRDYMQNNLQTEQEIWSTDCRDLLQLHAESVAVTKATGAADGDGAVLLKRAVEYMLQKNGMVDLSDILDNARITKQQGLLEDTMEKKRRKNEAAIDNVDTSVEDEDGKRRKIPINNPADAVNSRRGSVGILRLVTKGEVISDTEVNLKDYLSHRGYEEKDGFLLKSSGAVMGEDVLFQKYLMEMCGNYVKRKSNSRLSYQTEYVLCGNSTDYENLKEVVNRLLVLRETANFTYLMSDASKQAEAESLALTLSAVILFPELKDLIKLSILIAWAYAESVNDVRILLSGGKVALWKSSHTWRMGLKDALRLKMSTEGTGSDETGLSYEAYLHILLALTDKRERNLRFMDVIEMDIRQTDGNEHFQIDHCIDAFTVEMITASAKGHSCLIKRTVGYQK